MSYKYNPFTQNLDFFEEGGTSGDNPFKRIVEFGEDLNAGEPVFIYDDAGTPKVKKVFSLTGTENNYAHAINGATCKIDENTFVMAFSDLDDSSNGKVMVGSIQSDNSIVWGSEYEFYSGIANNISIITISPNKFVVFNRGLLDRVTARVGTVSGTTITLGASTEISTTSSFDISSATINTDKFVITFQDDDDSKRGKAIVGSVSGTTITMGAQVQFNGTRTFYTSVTSAGVDDKFVVFYRRAGTSNGYAQAATVTGITIDGFGAEAEFNPQNTIVHSSTDLDTDKVIVSYSDQGNARRGTLAVGILTGTTISFGAEYVFSQVRTDYSWIDKQATNEFVISYSDDDVDVGNVRFGGVSGDVVSLENSQTYYSSKIILTWITSLDTNKFVVTWSDESTEEGYALVVPHGEINMLDNCIGITDESGLLGEQKTVCLLGGITTSLSGLTAGTIMYIQDDATIDRIITPYQIGIALSSTDLLINKSRSEI